MTRRTTGPRALVFGLFLAGIALASTACEDPFEPLEWGDYPDTVELYSLARAEYVDRPAAFSIFGGRAGGFNSSYGPFTLELGASDPFRFDFAVTETDPGTFAFLPTGYFPQASSSGGIQAVDTASWNGIRRAPRDGYESEAPVPAEVGVIYAVRSRPANTGCRYYGKLEVLDLDPAGIATIRVLANANCGNRSLVPDFGPEEEADTTAEAGA